MKTQLPKITNPTRLYDEVSKRCKDMFWEDPDGSIRRISNQIGIENVKKIVCDVLTRDGK